MFRVRSAPANIAMMAHGKKPIYTNIDVQDIASECSDSIVESFHDIFSGDEIFPKVIMTDIIQTMIEKKKPTTQTLLRLLSTIVFHKMIEFIVNEIHEILDIYIM